MNREEMAQALSQNVEDGTVEMVGVDENGELLFKITELGERRVKELAAAAGFDLEKMTDLSLAEFMEAMGMNDD